MSGDELLLPVASTLDGTEVFRAVRASGAAVQVPVAAVRTEVGGQVSVAAYGAVGNGIADDTAALQAAFDSGRSIFIPAGTYNHTGLTFAGSVVIGGEGKTSILAYTGTGVGITISDGAREWAFRDLQITMAGNGKAIKFVGDTITFRLEGVTIQFPAYAAAAARIGYEFDLASGKYAAFGTFLNTRVHSAGYGLHVTAASGEVNALDFHNCEWGACWYGVNSEATTAHSQWSFVGGSFEVPSDGKTQMVFLTLYGLSMIGTRFETKNGAWAAAFIDGDYTTHSPIHFGPNCQRIHIVGAMFFPHNNGRVYRNEGIRHYFFNGQEGFITDTSHEYNGGILYKTTASALRTTAPVRTQAIASQTVDLMQHLDTGGTVRSGVSVKGVPYAVRTGQNASGALTVDASTGEYQVVGMSGNITSVTFTNATAGQRLVLRLNCGLTGRTVAGWASDINLAGGAFTHTSVTDKADVLTFVRDGSLSKWIETSRAMNLSAV